MNNLKSKHPDRDLLVTWQITGDGELLNELRPGGLSDELLSQLRHMYGQKSPAVWSVAIECDEPLCVPEEWYDEETIRGDVLRQLRELEESDDIPLDLEEFFPASLKGSQLAELARVSSSDRTGLLMAASKLGMDLMSLDDDEQ